MPVTFVNSASLAVLALDTTLGITPGAGADYIVGYSALAAETAFTATFNGDTMTLLRSGVGSADGHAGYAARMHGRAGDYTGASRNYVLSAASRWLHVAAFAGVDQASPTIGTGSTVVDTDGNASASITVLAADNPTGSRIVWGLLVNGFTEAAPTVNIGTLHETPNQFGEWYTALGSVAGNGSDQTITVTIDRAGRNLLLHAITLREASGSGPNLPTVPRSVVFLPARAA